MHTRNSCVPSTPLSNKKKSPPTKIVLVVLDRITLEVSSQTKVCNSKGDF